MRWGAWVFHGVSSAATIDLHAIGFEMMRKEYLSNSGSGVIRSSLRGKSVVQSIFSTFHLLLSITILSTEVTLSVKHYFASEGSVLMTGGEGNAAAEL